MKKYKSFIDFGKALSAIIDDRFVNFRGNLLEKSGSGYIFSGKYHATLEEVDITLNEQYKAFNNSINKIKQNNGK